MSHFEIGDKVKSYEGSNFVLVVEWVGRYKLGLSDGLDYVKHDCTKVIPYPEQWFNVDPSGSSSGISTRELADEFGTNDRIGLLHLFPDGTTEMFPITATERGKTK